MTFNNSLYTQITNQFFDLLSKNINKSSNRGAMIYTIKMAFKMI